MPPKALASATATLQPVTKQLDETRTLLADEIKKVQATYKRLSEKEETGSASDYMCKKLIVSYRTILELSAIESDLLAAISVMIGNIISDRGAAAGGAGVMTSRQSSVINSLDATLPVWPDLQPGPLCGANPAPPGWQITPGHLVAAMVSNPHEAEQRWILGSVMGSTGSTYIVEDIMEESDAQSSAKKERYSLSQNDVVPLPRWACIPNLPGTFFPPNAKVLALYPQTTCFYPAVVHQPPTREHPNTYKMHFYDDDYPDGRVRYQDVAVRFVVAARQPTPA
eukprot:m.189131 g.189131  ORF g.189131 m.189131 type:complete len:282 (-) comp17653_c0_seq1:205-1050(-)